MNTYYNRIQKPSGSFSVADILRMTSGMPFVNKNWLLKYHLVINPYTNIQHKIAYFAIVGCKKPFVVLDCRNFIHVI